VMLYCMKFARPTLTQYPDLAVAGAAQTPSGSPDYPDVTQ
jgi:hypothetical protein